MRWFRRLPLSLVFTALALAYMALATGLALLLSRWLAPAWLAAAGRG